MFMAAPKCSASTSSPSHRRPTRLVVPYPQGQRGCARNSGQSETSFRRMPVVHRRGFSSRANTAGTAAFRLSCRPRQRKKECRPAYRSRNPREGAQANGTGRHSLLGARFRRCFACSRIRGIQVRGFSRSMALALADSNCQHQSTPSATLLQVGIWIRPVNRFSTFSRPQSHGRTHGRSGNGGTATVAGATSGMDYKYPRIEKVKDAAQTVPAEPPQLKEQTGWPIFLSNWSRRF